MEWTELVLFTLGGKPVLLVDLVSSLLGLTCVFLAGRNSKYNFWVGYLYTAALFFLFWSRNLYANLLLQPISLAINVLGHWRWTHPRESEQSSEDSSRLKVSMLSWRGRGFVIGAILVVALVWGWAMDSLFPADPHPYLDCCVTVLILTAQLLSALKKWDCWIAWLLVNVTQIILHVSVGNVFMPIVCALYLINGLWSLWSWWKLYQKKA
ncbi:MAG: nicotinamide mononucleotide transporter [Bacteroidales bacterium]|nr:nicotinamide mononucleotide transporter [Bacteroidales bacterium]